MRLSLQPARLAAGVALFSMVAIGYAWSADTTLRVASTNKAIFDNLPFFVAMDAGLLKKQGLQIQLTHFRGGGEVVRALSTGSADVSMMATTAGIIATAKGQPLKLVSAFSAPAYGITWVVQPNSPIKSVKDLAGKKVGISRPGSVSHTGLVAALHEVGLQGKVDIVPVGGPGDGYAALKSGRVAATWFPAPDVYRLLEKGQVRMIIEISDYLKHYQQGSVWSTDSYLAKNGATVKKFLTAMQEAFAFIDAHHKEAADIGAKHTGFAASMELRTIEEMPKGFFHIGIPIAANYQGSAAEASGTGAIKQAPPLDKVMDKRFLP